MKIAENVEMLEVKIPRGEQTMTLYPTLIWNNNHLVLIDAGLPNSGEIIAQAIKNAVFDAKDLTEILLTHQDIDHIGGTRELLKFAPQAKVYAHEIDAPFIDGKKTPTKLEALEQRKNSLSPAELPFYNMLKTGFATAHLPVDTLLRDGDVLDLCGGIETVFTPGHTPGHASFYLRSSKIMVVGDAANIADNNELHGSNPAMTWDNEKAEASLAKIKSYDLNGVISYHTGYLKF